MTFLQKKISRKVRENFKEQTAFLSALVRANSSNPFTPDQSTEKRPIEKKVEELIYKKLVEIGLKPKKVGMSEVRPNVVCFWGSQRYRKSLILNGNMDTTPPTAGYTFEPYSGMVRDERLYGVGAADMKASLSAYIYAVKVLVDLGLKLDGRLILEFVVDEEPGGCSKLGSQYLLNQGYKAKAVIIGKPGTEAIGIGNRGGYRFKLTTFGEAVHTGRRAWEKRERGKNAIVEMAKVITALQNLEIPYKPAKAFPGRAPVLTFPTKINGGTAINMVPDRCVAYGDVRLMPGNSDRQLKILIRERLAMIKDIRYEINDLLFVPAAEASEAEEIVQVLAQEAKEVLKRRPKIEGSGPWGDGWMFITRDIPAVTNFGPDGEGVHGADEWVDLKSLKKVTQIYARVIVSYLGVRR